MFSLAETLTVRASLGEKSAFNTQRASNNFPIPLSPCFMPEKGEKKRKPITSLFQLLISYLQKAQTVGNLGPI